MNRMLRITIITVAACAAIAGSITLAQSQSSQDNQAGGDPPMQLPPGWTEADMMACVEAGTPGPMHKFLAESAGRWRTHTSMWMAPDTEPMTAEGTATVTPIKDGRFVKVEIHGEMPGMGMYDGTGIYGYDNVAQRFQCSWIDNHSTAIMNGVGELSSDGTTLTWTYNYYCPITKEPAMLREVERITGPNTKTLSMFGPDPKTGREYKLMEIEFTRQTGGAS